MKKHLTKQKTNIANKQTIMSAVEVSTLAKMMISDNLIPKNQRILSLGSGIGIDEEYFVNNAGVDVLGTDYEEEIIEQAKMRENNRLKFIQFDVTLPFTFKTPFECVYTRNLLHYFNSAEQRFILEQINSVLIAGGLLALQLKSKDDVFYTSKHYKKVIQNDGMHYFPQFRYSRNHLSEQETAKLLDLAGFDLHSIATTSEVLYNDEHESTLITAIARKKD